jgi:hypothetical protein
MDAGCSVARWNLAIIRLLQGRYREAWPYFGAHGNSPEWSRYKKDFGASHWRGEALEGRTLLIYTEHHGFGDAVWLARFFPTIKQRSGGRVLLMTFEPMRRLLAGQPGLDLLLVDGDPLPPFEYSIPLMELPVALDIDPASLPPPIEIAVDGGHAPELPREGFRVGLVWAGNPAHTNDAHRSVGPRLFDALADLPDVAWYGLQKPPSEEPPRLPCFTDLSPHMGDFMDTAGIVKQLDLLVSVDTSTAHVAGSLGIPTILLLPRLPDWRWGLGARSTPWYHSFTLLRQPSHGDWQSVVGMLKEEIWRIMGQRG